MKSRGKEIAAMLILCAAGVVGTVKLFGTTVSTKFNDANSSVSSQVYFGGPSDGYVASRRPSRPARVYRAQPEERPTVVPNRAKRPEEVSTFSVDVDTGSYTLARKALRDGYSPDRGSVRVEEFLNYFPYDYEMPPKGRPARVQVEAAPSPFDDTAYLVSIGIQGGQPVERKPVHLTFLVDVSGSMDIAESLPLAKQSILTAVQSMEPDDKVAIVTYAGDTRVALETTRAGNIGAISNAVANLRAGGGTAMGSGMQLAYEIAAEHAGKGKVSRVMVMSDGDANIGRSSAHGILDDIRAAVNDGVTMTTVGFGTGAYSDAMMERLADAGNGNYVYIDSADEIPLVFSERFDSMLHVIAKDVKVQIDFDDEAVASWKQIGYENRQMAAKDFRNDAVDAGEIGAGHQVTALYEVKLRRGVSRSQPLAVARFRYKRPDEARASEVSTTLMVRDIATRIGDASADFRFQAAVAAFAMNLRGDERSTMTWIEELARTSTNGRRERQELLPLIRKGERRQQFSTQLSF